jgi:pimeloyl-ACP methyl ester carboxylesterase
MADAAQRRLRQSAGMAALPPLDTHTLPRGIRARFLDGINGLRIHLLEAGDPAHPCVLLLHGFPELAYSWRKVMLPLAEAGFHVVAPDQRGYGRTTGWDDAYDTDLAPFRMLNLVRDAMGVLAALGHGHARCVVGHDFGSPLAAWCAIVRPDLFRSAVLMSAPFPGPPVLPEATPGLAPPPDIHAALASLPRPRKHYQWYYSGREANANMHRARQGLASFLRAYYHVKSADWPGNTPYRLAGWTAEALSELPTYYIMDAGVGMAETVAPFMPTADQVAACRWLPEEELAVYAAEYGRTGFQGGLDWYRCATGGQFAAEAQLFAGRTIDVPAMFAAGAADWGIYQVPGALERLRDTVMTRSAGVHLIPGAGHWVQQEQPEAVSRLLLRFLGDT